MGRSAGGLTSVPGIRVGHATDEEAQTGCTVVLGPFRAGSAVVGFATGTRELEALSPGHLAERADAIVLAGGAAFGLAAADGVAAWLAERGTGFDAGVARVPIVAAAVIFDLGQGRSDRWPDAAMGRAACDAASGGPVAEGRVGAGTGATVGKVRGMAGAMPGGVGTHAVAGPGYRVGALVVVNAFGDVRDAECGILAGARAEDGTFVDTESVLRRGEGLGAFGDAARGGTAPGTNTTLAVVATDAPLSRNALQGLARSASAALWRRLAPAGSPFDGDVVFALSTSAEPRQVGPGYLACVSSLSVHALELAIERAVS